jgi:hypothetical protein
MAYNQLLRKPVAQADQKPNPPIYIPGGGSIGRGTFALITTTTIRICRSLAISAARSSRWLLGPGGHMERMNPLSWRVAQTIYVADTDAEAEKLYAEIKAISTIVNHLWRLCRCAGYRTIKTLQANVTNALSEDMQQVFLR